MKALACSSERVSLNLNVDSSYILFDRFKWCQNSTQGKIQTCACGVPGWWLDLAKKKKEEKAVRER